jgi:hypothetical protein
VQIIVILQRRDRFINSSTSLKALKESSPEVGSLNKNEGINEKKNDYSFKILKNLNEKKLKISEKKRRNE